MKQWLKKHIPTKASVKKFRELKIFKLYLNKSSLWKWDCQTVASGVSAGLAACVLPGFQIFYAAFLVIIMRGNLPIALVATLVTNPFTAVPIVYFIYYIGTLIIGNGHSNFVLQKMHWDFSSFHAFWLNISNWFLQFGKAFLVGLPIVSLCLGLIGYFATILICKLYSLIIAK